MSARARTGLRARAFAKINLTLRVLGIRADGYHELRTVFQSLALHDVLTLTPTDGPFALACDDAACVADRSNLVWQAAERLWRAAGRAGAPRGVHVRLEKRIPLEAGLGGGSSDAAAALRALAAFWRVELPAARLRDLAAALGADVPFFLDGGTALGVDRGDVIFRLPDWPGAAVVVAVPDFGVSTAEAYRWWDGDQHAARPARLRTANAQPVAGGLPPGELVNDLQRPVERRHPAIRRIVNELRRNGAHYAAMSGSGSAVFGLFEAAAAAERAAAALKTPRRRVFFTRVLGAAEYTRLAVPHGLAAG